MDSDTWAFIFISLIKKQDSMATCHACPAMRVCLLIYVPLKRVLYCSYGRNGNRYIKAAHDTVPQNVARHVATNIGG